MRPNEVVEAYLEENDIDWEPDGDDAWYIRIVGENKKSPGISMIVRIGERTVQVKSYFIRAPEPEVQAEAYRWILQKNMRQYLRFACDEEGAIHLVGQVPLECFDAQELDRIIGSVLQYQDESFKPFLRLGFPRALEAIRQGKPIPED